MRSREVQLALGTVQFGMPYGVSGRGVAVPCDEVRDILSRAWERGVRVLDTAPGYGDIEQRLGDLVGARQFEIVSKIPALPATTDTAEISRFVRGSIEQSRARLGDRLTVILFHQGEDLLTERADAAWEAAASVASTAGLRVGGAFYSPAAAGEVRGRYPLAVAQLPGNALDQRLADRSATASLADVDIHLRSVFLQGLLLMSVQRGGERVPKAAEWLNAWTKLCDRRGVTPLRAALSIVRMLPAVRYCVVGIDRLAHLDEIVDAWSNTAQLDVGSLACDDQDVIDPRRWRKA